MPAVPLRGERHRPFGDGRHALAIDVLHREHVHVRRAHQLLFPIVEIAHADEDGVRGQHLRRETGDAGELRRFRAEERRERHAVHVAARRAGRRIHVAMRVDPQEADRQLPFGARPVRRGRNRSRGETVIAAEGQRQRACVERRAAGLIQRLADARDFADVPLVLVARAPRLRNRRRQVAFVGDVETERAQAIRKSGDAKRRRSHVHAAPAAAEIQGNADEMNAGHVSGKDNATSDSGLGARGRRRRLCEPEDKQI